MDRIVDEELVRILENATEKAFTKLFEEHDEHYYYCTLVTSGECYCPAISAWSTESLEREASKAQDVEQEKYYLKWDYASSPYCGYGYDEYFGEAREAFAARDREIEDADDEAFEREMELRLNSREQAMANMDARGLFGQDSKRLSVVVNAEYMPPDEGNTERAKRLNPEEAIREWLEEAAEM